MWGLPPRPLFSSSFIIRGAEEGRQKAGHRTKHTKKSQRSLKERGAPIEQTAQSNRLKANGGQRKTTEPSGAHSHLHAGAHSHCPDRARSRSYPHLHVPLDFNPSESESCSESENQIDQDTCGGYGRKEFEDLRMVLPMDMEMTTHQIQDRGRVLHRNANEKVGNHLDELEQSRFDTTFHLDALDFAVDMNEGGNRRD